MGRRRWLLQRRLEPESLGRAEKPEHRALEKGQVGSGQPSIHNTALTPQTRRLHSNQT